MSFVNHLAIGAILASLSIPAWSVEVFQPGNILIQSNNVVREYTTDGTYVSSVTIPPNSSNETARDVYILEDGRLAVFNGTFDPELAIFNGSQWEQYQSQGWSTVNNITFGGITSIGDEVFVTDSFTFSGGEATGIVAFDSSFGTSDRFLHYNEYIDVTLGGDGLLYALRNQYGALDIIDPVTMAIINSVALGHTSGSRGVVANEAGEIYMASWNGYVARYTADGVLTNTLTISNNLSDIDMDSSGQLIVGDRFGGVHLIDGDLSSFSSFQVGDRTTFVAFVPAATAVPDPPTLAGTSIKKKRYLNTTLSWNSDAAEVDVYYNDQIIDTQPGSASTTYSYRFRKKMAQVFKVCNAGTEDCSADYVAN